MVDAQHGIVLSSDAGVDLGDVILCEMRDTLGKLRVLIGDNRPVVDLGHGLEIVIDEQDALQPWRERICVIQDSVKFVLKQYPVLVEEDVCKAILKADGWTWTAFTFRTPIWLMDHDEVLRPVVAREYEVLAWLERFSLEIK